MQKSFYTWQLIQKSLQQHIPVMLLYVLESKGSSPGRQGFFMAVNAKHEMEGSIGGGIMEHKFVEMAKEKLRTSEDEVQESVLKKQIHDKQAATNQSGMICSGEQTVYLYPLKESDSTTIHKIITSLEENHNGALQLSPSGIEFSDEVPETDYRFTRLAEDNWLYVEKTGYKHKLFIIGGGHCSLALSRLMRALDFYIHVVDDRPGLKTFEDNLAAHKKQVIADYTQLPSYVPAGLHHYVVIMTFGYRTDDIALRSLLGKKYRYLGVMGSKKKMETLFAQYRQEGFVESLLQQVYTPIGLPISSQTPEEIAVSIAAEIIRIKNN